MAFVDTSKLPVVERRPGWRGRSFNSPSMTFAHDDFDAGSTIHEHRHPQEEVWEIIEGELEIAIDGVTRRAGPGVATIVPPDTRHAVRALTDGKAIVIDYPCARWLDFQPIILIMFLLASCIGSGAAAYRLFGIGRAIFDIVDRSQSSGHASATAGSRAPTRARAGRSK